MRADRQGRVHAGSQGSGWYLRREAECFLRPYYVMGAVFSIWGGLCSLVRGFHEERMKEAIMGYRAG